MIATTQLRRVFRLVNGGTPTSDETNWGGTVPWATPVDLSPAHGGVLQQTARTLTETGLKTGSACVPAGSLIISTRAPIGYVATVEQATAFNQGCRGLVPTTSVDLRYFNYYLVASRGLLESRGQGSTFVELSSDALMAIPVASPAVEAQRAIADFLDAETARIDALIAKKRRMIEASEERLTAISVAWYADLVDSWGTVPIRRIGVVEQGSSPACDNAEAEPEEWGVLKTSAVSSGVFRANDKRLPSGVEPEERWRVNDGDLMVTRGSGSASAVGRCAVAHTESRHLLLPDLVYRIRLREADPRFVAASIEAPMSRQFLVGSIRSDSGQTLKIRSDDLKDVAVPAVPPGQQGAALEALRLRRSPVIKIIRKLGHQIELLRERRQALITVAVTGELTIP